MNLYLKYRPRKIEELDLASVRRALLEIVKANKMSHAYLLTGPRGSGKTSTARVLARLVNCEKNEKRLGEPCNECPACTSILSGSALDVIEIDAASNRGIDDIRELKEKIRLAPAVLRTKVYIIDEVHMLTTEAFNALLKTLEEPPSHSLFILCTTETHKVPETIVSRCTRMAFTKATPEEMVRSFTRVLTGEGAVIDGEGLSYLAGAVDGSFRDGVKILDQLVSAGRVVNLANLQEVHQGLAGFDPEPFARALVDKKGREALSIFRELNQAGLEMVFFLTATMRVLRDAIVAPYTGERITQLEAPVETAELVYKIDETLRRATQSPVQTILVEMMIVDWCGEGEGGEGTKDKEQPPQEAKKSEPMPAVDGGEIWQKITGGVGEGNYALGTLLSKARPGKIRGNELTIYVEYDFHRQQLMSGKMRAKFEELVTLAVGVPMRVVCEVAESPAGAAEDDTIAEAVAIFSS